MNNEEFRVYLDDIKSRIHDIQDELYRTVLNQELMRGTPPEQAKELAIEFVEKKLGLGIYGWFRPTTIVSEHDLWN